MLTIPASAFAKCWAGVLLAAVVALAGLAPAALAQANHVYAAGSDSYGQLGVGDAWTPNPSLISPS